jgi:hypothetical protein
LLIEEARVLKRTGILLLPDDEALIEDTLKKEFPQVCFIDQRAWVSVDAPPVRTSIQNCSDIAAIWNPAVAPEVRGMKRSNGSVHGPQVGPVLQWLRSQRGEGQLQAGSWAASVDPVLEPEMEAFARAAWRTLRRLTSNDLISGGWLTRAVVTGPPVRRFRVGAAALSAARNGELELGSNQARLLPLPARLED